MQNYNDTQIEDIKNRMEEGSRALESVGLRIAVQIIPYLQDTKYTNPDGTLKEVPEMATVVEAVPAQEEIASIPSDNAEVNPSI